MNSTAKRGVISPYQLFFIFLVSRAVVALTFYQSILKDGISPDTLLSSALALIINLLLCFPALLCCTKNKNPINSKIGKLFYLGYFLFFEAVNISRFAFFAADKTTKGSSALFFIVIMAAAAAYASHLGIEAIGRFCAPCAMISVFVLLIIILLNSESFHYINFMPFFVGTRSEIIENALIFSSNSIEPALLLVLFDKCSTNQKKSLLFGIAASYVAIFLMMLFCIGVLGSAASLFSYPVYTLFQMTAFGSFSRLDIVYTAFGFFALFAKCAVVFYCAEQTLFKVPRKTRAPLLFIASCVLSLVIYQRFYDEMMNSARSFYLFISLAFLLIVPLLSLIFMKKEEANEKRI